MCADLGHLEKDLQALERAGADELHFDIMDGIFVPNFTLGFDLIKAAKACTGLPCNGHLMISRPERYIERFVEAGCDSITVHIETTKHPHRLIEQIRDTGASPGIALNPATPLSKLQYLLPMVDRVLVMSVDPGYAGQRLIDNAFDRVRILNENITHYKYNARIEVDGNISVENCARFVRFGGRIFVLGTSSIFQGPGTDFSTALPKFRQDVADAMQVA